MREAYNFKQAEVQDGQLTHQTHRMKDKQEAYDVGHSNMPADRQPESNRPGRKAFERTTSTSQRTLSPSEGTKERHTDSSQPKRKAGKSTPKQEQAREPKRGPQTSSKPKHKTGNSAPTPKQRANKERPTNVKRAEAQDGQLDSNAADKSRRE